MNQYHFIQAKINYRNPPLIGLGRVTGVQLVMFSNHTEERGLGVRVYKKILILLNQL